MNYKPLFAVGFSALLSACSLAGPADVIGYPTPVDETSQLRPPPRESVVTGYTHREPTSPKSWIDQNRRQTPGAGS
ncbi:MAG: hypothetical protein R3D32_07800 [Nitratireductor sp.]